MSASGQSWYAMEYVDGQTILQHADAYQLDTRARVALMARATGAVAAAQAQDIVHRDLKPSNIMVDSSGRPRLLDFGIAKWLTPTDPADDTATGLRALSPAYAAPEQVCGEPISRATDVYALGIVLHELLVGERPNRRADRSLEGLAEQVRVEQPLAPSVHARIVHGASHRGIESALDDIVLTWGLLVAGVGVWSTWSATGDHASLVPPAAEQPANTDAAMACQQPFAQHWPGAGLDRLGYAGDAALEHRAGALRE